MNEKQFLVRQLSRSTGTKVVPACMGLGDFVFHQRIKRNVVGTYFRGTELDLLIVNQSQTVSNVLNF